MRRVSPEYDSMSAPMRPEKKRSIIINEVSDISTDMIV